MIKKIKNFIKYLIGKKSEVADLETKDILLGKTIVDIHRKKTHSSLILVPLFDLYPVHAIDRENAIKDTEARVVIVEESKEILLQEKNLTKEILNNYLPSVSGVKVVRSSANSFISYEGNGRLVALQKVFKPSDDMHIEVEEYSFKNSAKILKDLEIIRQLNGLTN